MPPRCVQAGRSHPTRTGGAIANKTLRDGERKAIEALSRAIALHGESHPIVRKCIGWMLGIASGEISGRYVGDRYRGICRMLDMLCGKPREAPKPRKGDARGAIAKLMDDIESDESEASEP